MIVNGTDVHSLKDSVALVTGASRGVGRGIAEVLNAAGATVYATGRTVATHGFNRPIHCVPCDHTDDRQVTDVFARIAVEQGQLDVLVNSAWGGYERMVENGRFTWSDPFWEQPCWRWDAMMVSGLRAAFVASQHAARLMVKRQRGLIVNLSYWAAKKYVGNVIYGMAKAATDKLTADTAHELKEHGVTVVSLYPGLVRTEAVLAAGALDLANSESTEFVGRAVVALAQDNEIIRRSGQTLVVAQLAGEYGFTDVDGTCPRPLGAEDV